jgi:glycerol-3-phosphate acyltransferase PlsY
MFLIPVLIITGYLIGSLSAAIIVCRVMGLQDPRESGSKNPGATNVLRLHGKKPGGIALLGDLLKGVIPVLAARYSGAPDWVIASTGLAVFLGHLFPVFFQFRGGKGVATLLGVLLASYWLLGLMFIVTWLVIAGLSRYSSAAGVTAAVLSPVYAFWILPDPSYSVSFTLMSLLLLWRHRQNIERILAGTESKIGTGR